MNKTGDNERLLSKEVNGTKNWKSVLHQQRT